MRKPVAHTTATYRTKAGPRCDLVRLAKHYSQVGHVPERLAFARASEIALLSREFLNLYRFYRKAKR